MIASMIMPNVAESTGELYWKLKLGNTAMPKIVKDAIIGSDKNTKIVLKNMIKKGFTVSEELEKSIRKDAEIVEYLFHFEITDQQKQSIIKLNQESNFENGNSAIDLTRHSVYFVENDLTRPGKTLKLNFMKVEDDAKFIPTEVDESIPFTSTKFPEILSIFSLKPNSTSAEIMEETIKACETKAMSDEMKFCATTLEKMVDYVTSNVGNQNVTTFEGHVDENVQNVHKIVDAKKVRSNKSMVCHKMGYPYSVFYCHNLQQTNLYEISMVDPKGTKVNAVGVCHKDTSSWSRQHISFQILKVAPGSPVCHFLNERSIAFVSKSEIM
ncbi:hypothetical protein RND81_02G208800 [Saponaria officinalis]|uniref:BURP domain-containing protein n=1 Tax=Saponaria officinalis TaxID=3572 RepID=A0AAW1MP70_SAPOF